MLKHDEDYRKFATQGVELKVNLKGAGLSLIDEEPKELIYACVMDLDLDFATFRHMKPGSNDKVKEIRMDTTFTIGHVQIDNMIDDANPVIFCPK
jgi:hypothetical protein